MTMMITHFPEKETDDTEVDSSRSHSQAVLAVADLEVEAVAAVSEALAAAEVSAAAALLVAGRLH